MAPLGDSVWVFSRDFTLVWAGQLISIVGSGIAGFGLSEWVYQATGSATQFTVVMVLATLPMVLLWPVAGPSAIPQVLLTPLVFSFGTEVELGVVMSTLGIGMGAEGLVMTIWGGPKRLAPGIILGAAFRAGRSSATVFFRACC